MSPASARDFVRLARRSSARAASSPMCWRTWSRSISPSAAGVEADWSTSSMRSSWPSCEARSVARLMLIGPSPLKSYDCCQPASGTARWRFWARRSTCQRRSMSSRTESISARSWACCSGDIEFHTAWAAAMRSASCSRSSSRVLGSPGNMSPYCAMKSSKLGSSSSPRSRCSSILLRASYASRMRAICSGLMLESASDVPSKNVSAISRRSSSTSSSKRSRASEDTKS